MLDTDTLIPCIIILYSTITVSYIYKYILYLKLIYQSGFENDVIHDLVLTIGAGL